MINVVNPGSINIADQGGPPTLVNQAVQVGPSTDAGPVVQVADQGGRPATVDQSVKVGPSQSAGVAARAADLAPGTGVAREPPLSLPRRRPTGPSRPAPTHRRDRTRSTPSKTRPSTRSTARACPPTSTYDHATG